MEVMKISSLFIFFLLLHQQGIANIPYNHYWQKANSFYQEKQYDSAAYYYEQLAAHHPKNSEIYYNLGNAYYRLNNVGSSVLNYERALKFSPGNKEAKDNLEITKSRIINRIPQTEDIFFVKWWKSITRTTLAETWAILSLVVFLVILSVFVLRRWDRATSWLRPQFITALTVLWICLLVIAYVAANKTQTSSRAVVMRPDAPLRTENKKEKTQKLIPEGTVVKLDTEEGGWVRVTLPDGTAGWVEKSAVEKI